MIYWLLKATEKSSVVESELGLKKKSLLDSRKKERQPMHTNSTLTRAPTVAFLTEVLDSVSTESVRG
jgi:hypothetical protein